MSAGNLRNELGPYKATKLWNDIVRVFRTGMPIGRHWKQLKVYDDCFVASEAVDWLYEFLQQHHEAGAELTRPQVVKLLQKFHRNNYIEDVKGYKYNSETFEENNRLFRFVALSPIKTPQWPRVIAGSCPDLTESKRHKSFSDLRTHNIFQQLEPNAQVPVSAGASNQNHQGDHPPPCVNRENKPISKADMDNIWKTMVVERLKHILQIHDISVLGYSISKLKNDHAKHNMTVLHKNGYVTGISKAQLPPSWVISAMRYLAKWPDKGSESFPEYPGFEKDVFIMIRDYFESVSEPLTTHLLYPVLISIYNTVESCEPSPIEGKLSRVLHVSDTTPRRRQPSNSATHQPLLKRHSLVDDYKKRPGPQQPPSYNNMYAANRGFPDQEQLRGRLTHSPKSQPSVEELIVVYDDDSRDKESAPTAYQPPQQHSERQYHYEPRAHNYNSYRLATQNRPHFNINNNNNNNDSEDKSSSAAHGFVRQRQLLLQRQQQGGITRAASLSHLLVGPRIETAFVGQDAYTVYYGANRNNTRTQTSTSTGLLMRAQSAYHIDQSTPDSATRYPQTRDTGIHTAGRSLSTQYIDQSPSHQSYTRSRISSENSSSQSSAYYTAYQSRAQLGSVSSNSIDDSNQYPKHTQRRQYIQSGHSYDSANRPEVVKSPDNVDLYQDTGSIRLKFHSTPSVNDQNLLPYGLCSESRDRRLLQSLQLILLFLPPANRRILHMLLKLLNKTASNNELTLDSEVSNRKLRAEQSVISSLGRSVIRSNSESEFDQKIASSLVEFMVQNYEQIMTVPQELKQDILARINSTTSKRTQEAKTMRPASAVLKSKTNLVSSEENTQKTKIPAKAIDRLGITPSKVYCEQITSEQMKSQATRVFESSMRELLRNIVEDKKMTTKEKTKKLKQFERTYPEIFAERFPTSDSVRRVLVEHDRRQPKLKPALLTKPMNLLRKLR